MNQYEKILCSRLLLLEKAMKQMPPEKLDSLEVTESECERVWREGGASVQILTTHKNSWDNVYKAVLRNPPKPQPKSATRKFDLK